MTICLLINFTHSKSFQMLNGTYFMVKYTKYHFNQNMCPFNTHLYLLADTHVHIYTPIRMHTHACTRNTHAHPHTRHTLTYTHTHHTHIVKEKNKTLREFKRKNYYKSN